MVSQHEPTKWVLAKHSAGCFPNLGLPGIHIPWGGEGQEDFLQACERGGGQGLGAAGRVDVGAKSDTSTAKAGAVQLGRGPCTPSLPVDLGQQQGEGHGQGTVVEAVDVGVVPILQGVRGLSVA